MRLNLNLHDIYSSELIQLETPEYRYEDDFVNEFGHLLFLKDRYVRNGKILSGHRGWKNNIMNDSDGVVELRNIEILFSGIDRERAPFLVDPWAVYVQLRNYLCSNSVIIFVLKKGERIGGPLQHFD